MQQCLSFRELHSLDPTKALSWTHWELTATTRPPAAFRNVLWSLHVLPTAQLPQNWEFFLSSYWDWDFGLFQCWELGSESPSPPSGPSVEFIQLVYCIITCLSFLNCGYLLIREVQWFYWTQELLVPVEKFTSYIYAFKIRTCPAAFQMISNFRINLPFQLTYSNTVLYKPKSTSALIEAVLGGHACMQRKN